jgi:putative endonuclease
MYFVYILYSATLDLFYIGSSENPQERLKKHLASHRGFTSKAKDWTIVYREAFDTKSEALVREQQLKRWKNRNRIKKLIENFNLSSAG